MTYFCELATHARCQKSLAFCRLSFCFMIKLRDWRFKTLGVRFCIRSHNTGSTLAERPLFCLMGFRVRCCLPFFVCNWDSSIPNCILFHSRTRSRFSSSVLCHMRGYVLVPVFDGDHLNMTSPPVLLQKVLSDLQAENQQRLKEREQELKDLKKVMEVTKVSRQSFLLQNPHQPLHHHRLFPCAAVCR